MVSAGEILISTTLLMVVVKGGNPPCPDLCKCPIVYRADCLNLSLTRVPANLNTEIRFLNVSNNHLPEISTSVLSNSFQHLRILDLSNNKISLIQNGAMRDMKELIFLYLSGNEITSMDQKVFEYNPRLEFLKLDKNVLLIPSEKPFLNIPSLKSLDIASCNIRIIPALTFVKLQNLQELELSHNRLLSLDSAVFLPLKHLKFLYLSDNLLTELPSDIFVSLRELEILDLSKNQIYILNSQAFTFLENVEFLNLSHNKLKSLEIGVFASMTNLKRLHLHNNILSSISENQFSDLNNLSVLDISGNHLENLHFRVFCRLHNLIYLKVSENKLSCDCALWQLWKWSNDKNTLMLSTCKQPGFEISDRGFEELRKNNNCSATMCELKIDNAIPQEIFTPIYLYVTIGFGLLLVIIAICLTVWAVFRFRNEMCRKRNTQVSATEHSLNTMTYISRQHAEQLAQLHQHSLQRQLDLQHDLHRRHQESLMRNHLHHENSISLKTLAERDQTNNDNRHSYHEQRFASVADDESSWFNADTLPSMNRTSVFLPNVPSPNARHSSGRDRSMSEPRFKEHSRRGSAILEGDTSTPKYDSSVLCPLPKGARGSLILDISSGPDVVEPEESVETNRL